MKNAVREVKIRIPQTKLLLDYGTTQYAWIGQRDKWAANHFENLKMWVEESQELSLISLKKVNSALLQDVSGEITETMSGIDDHSISIYQSAMPLHGNVTANFENEKKRTRRTGRIDTSKQ